MRSGWIRYERIAGSLRCHRHGVKQQVFCEGDPEKLSCLRQQAICRVPDSKGRGRHLQNRKIRGEVPLMEWGLATLPFASMSKRGTAGRPSARSHCPSTSILHLPTAQGQTQTPQWPAAQARDPVCVKTTHMVQAGRFCVPTEPTAGIRKDVNPGGGGSVLRSGWEGIRLIRKLHRARRSRPPHSVSAKEQ